MQQTYLPTPHPKNAVPETGDLVIPGKPASREARLEVIRAEVIQDLTRIWEELLGVSPIGVHDNFFQIGADSMAAMKVVSRARKEGYILQPKDLFIQQTIGRLSLVIANRLVPEKEPVVPGQQDTVTAVATVDGSHEKARYLVPLRTAGNKTPLYIICGAGGSALRFLKFVDMMDPGQPAFALQPPLDKKDLRGFPDTVAAIATAFIEEIQLVQGAGPYALSGHCAGGYIALEMARQLSAAGHEIQMLALFDTILETNDTNTPSFANGYGFPVLVKRRISALVLKLRFETFLLKSHTRSAVGYKIASVRNAFSRIAGKKEQNPQEEYKGLEIFDELSGIYVAACKNYKLLSYDKKVTLFYALEHYHFVDKENDIWFGRYNLSERTKNAWKQYFDKTVIYEVAGEHSDIFDPLHCGQFAKLLQYELDKG